MRKCLNCSENLEGRSDKKFCSSYCKSSYHYKKKADNPSSFFEKVDKQLKLNRLLLKTYNKAGKSIIRKSVLISAGFNPKYFTHYWKNQKNEVYLFCYEFGFFQKKEKNIDKYVLVSWQSYMEK